MSGIDPTTVRLSDNFLLSDFMGCDSVYRKGYANPFTTADEWKLKQGRKLASELDEIYHAYGPLSVTYGYISPRLSRQIVKYQDPNKLSFHRWDLGAAADICVHQWFDGDMSSQNFTSPIGFVWDYMNTVGSQFDRIITYSESEIVCMAWSDLGREPWNRVYENRFLPGKPKPGFIKYPTNNDGVRLGLLMTAAELVESTWRGQGYPRYHGGGRRQYEHRRMGESTLLSDLLYSPVKVHKGIPNKPPSTPGRADLVLGLFSLVDEDIQTSCWLHGGRPSIVFAIDCNERPWSTEFVVDYVPSPGLTTPALALFENTVSQLAKALDSSTILDVRLVKMRRGENRIRVVGSPSEI